MVWVEEGVAPLIAWAKTADAPDRHDSARDGQVLHAAVGVLHFEPHHFARLPEDSLDHGGELEPPGRLIVNRFNDIAGPQPRLDRRRVGQRGHDGDVPVLELELGPDPRDLALKIAVHFGQLLEH